MNLIIYLMYFEEFNGILNLQTEKKFFSEEKRLANPLPYFCGQSFQNAMF